MREIIFVIVPLRESVRVSDSISKYRYYVTAISVPVTPDDLARLRIISGVYTSIS